MEMEKKEDNRLSPWMQELHDRVANELDNIYDFSPEGRAYVKKWRDAKEVGF